MTVLAIVTAALAVGLSAYAVLDMAFSEEHRVRRRLEALESYGVGAVAEAQPLFAPFRERVVSPVGTWLARMLRAMAPRGYLARLARRLVTSGRPAHPGVERMLLAKLAALLASGLMAFVLGEAVGAPMAPVTRFSVVLALLGSYLPDLWLRSQAESRQAAIARQLPDMLDMLTISVEAGLGFDQAVMKYVQNARGPLSREFAVVLREVSAGMSRRDALRALGDRCDVAEVRAFIMAIVQADVFGVSISDVLRVQSRELRLKRRQRAEELAQKAPARMVFPLVLFIMPATLIVVMGPAVIRIARVFFGM
mgnify:CR=1 FL=1